MRHQMNLDAFICSNGHANSTGAHGKMKHISEAMPSAAAGHSKHLQMIEKCTPVSYRTTSSTGASPVLCMKHHRGRRLSGVVSGCSRDHARSSRAPAPPRLVGHCYCSSAVVIQQVEKLF